MTEKELHSERCKLDLIDAESNLRQAQSAYDEGVKKHMAAVEQARAEASLEVVKLKEELFREKNNVAREALFLKRALEVQKQGFE